MNQNRNNEHFFHGRNSDVDDILGPESPPQSPNLLINDDDVADDYVLASEHECILSIKIKQGDEKSAYQPQLNPRRQIFPSYLFSRNETVKAILEHAAKYTVT